MEEQKNSVTADTKAAPAVSDKERSKEKTKKERSPLTESQRLKRQKMIVLPVMVLAFIGAMWLIFSPPSDKTGDSGSDGFNTEMPDADKGNKNIIGDKSKAYEQPSRDNAEMDELMERISSLETELGNEKEKGATVDEQVALMEKSYELAAKYMGGQNGGQTGSPSQSAQNSAISVQKTGKGTVAPVKQVSSQVVSALGQPMSNAEFMAAHAQERNYGFNTAVGGTAVSERNTLSACVYGAQSVTDGQAVKLRLLEPMAVADMVIPRNALLVGAAKIQGVGKWAVCGRVRAATDKQAHAATLNLFTSAVHEYEDLQSEKE